MDFIVPFPCSVLNPIQSLSLLCVSSSLPLALSIPLVVSFYFYIQFANSVHKRKRDTCLCLVYFILHDNLQFYPFSCRQYDYILLYDWIKLHCVYMTIWPYFLCSLTCSWVPRLIYNLPIVSRVAIDPITLLILPAWSFPSPNPWSILLPLLLV